MDFIDRIAVTSLQHDLSEGWDSLDADLQADVFSDWCYSHAVALADTLTDNFDTVIALFERQVAEDLDAAIATIRLEGLLD